MGGNLERTMGRPGRWFQAHSSGGNQKNQGHHGKEASSRGTSGQTQQGRGIRRMVYPGAQSPPTGTLG
eukprot:1312896-Heterocapsa_arctica.AAC.1